MFAFGSALMPSSAPALTPSPPTSTPAHSAPGVDAPTWADQLEAWSTLAGAVVALLAATFTLWLLVHQIREARRARADAAMERADAAADRELARQDRETAANERRDAEMAQARLVAIGDGVTVVSSGGIGRGGGTRRGLSGIKGAIVNFSQTPVFAVVAVLVATGRDGDQMEKPIDYRSVLEGGSTFVIELDFESNQAWRSMVDEPESIINAGRKHEVLIRFSDASGRRWQRSGLSDPEPRNSESLIRVSETGYRRL
jgi:hypothetical protein